MIRTPTVLILGAGASAHLGFPTGKELKERVVRATTCAQSLSILAEAGCAEADIRAFGDKLQRCGGVCSVDEFLQTRADLLDIGKALIAYELIKYEDEAKLHQDRQDNWYHYLFGRICGNCFEDFNDSRLVIITFNYDRSLEQFLFSAFKNRFDESDQDVLNMLSRFTVYHVHGQIGRLPWQSGSGPVREYGSKITGQTIRAGAAGIQVIHEEVRSAGNLDIIQTVIKRSPRICFLGLGYHELNMQRVWVPIQEPGRALGTSFSFDDSTARHVEDLYKIQLLFKNGEQRKEILDLLRNEGDLT